MKIFAVLAILIVIIVGVNWIESGAYAKIEAERLAEAVRFKEENTIRANNRAEEIEMASLAREDNLRKQIEALEAINMLPPVVNENEEGVKICPVDCQLRWE